MFAKIVIVTIKKNINTTLKVDHAMLMITPIYT